MKFPFEFVSLEIYDLISYTPKLMDWSLKIGTKPKRDLLVISSYILSDEIGKH